MWGAQCQRLLRGEGPGANEPQLGGVAGPGLREAEGFWEQTAWKVREGLLAELMPGTSLGTGRPVSLWLEPRSVLAGDKAVSGEVDWSHFLMALITGLRARMVLGAPGPISAPGPAGERVTDKAQTCGLRRVTFLAAGAIRRSDLENPEALLR